MSSLTKIIASVYNGENPLNQAKEGRVFLKRLMSDRADLDNLIRKRGIKIDNLGISGNDLFKLTLNIFNREEMPGEDKFTLSGNKLCVIYYGICPELENFVSVVLWPEESDTSKNVFKEIRGIVKSDKESELVLELSGNYKLGPPNKIHPFRIDEVKTSKDHSYLWEYVPYIKEIGDTINSHKSPIVFRRAFIEDIKGEHDTRYINLKVCPGIVLKKLKNELRFKLPYLYENRYRPFVVSVYHKTQKDLEEINENDKVLFMVLEQTNGNVNRIINRFEKIESLQIVSHLLCYSLYRDYLKKGRLRLMSQEEYHDRFIDCLKITQKFCKTLSDSQDKFFEDDLVLKAFLSPFFRKIDDQLYYIPKLLLGCKDHEIIILDQLLAEEIKSSPVNLLRESGFIKNLGECGPIIKLYRNVDLVLSIKRLIYKTDLEIVESEPKN